jgi:hypothetical protein
VTKATRPGRGGVGFDENLYDMLTAAKAPFAVGVVLQAGLELELRTMFEEVAPWASEGCRAEHR